LILYKLIDYNMNLFNKLCKSFLSCFGCSAKHDGKDKNDFKIVIARADLVFVAKNELDSDLAVVDNASYSIAQSPPPPPPPPRENSADNSVNSKSGVVEASDTIEESPKSSLPSPPPSPVNSHLGLFSIGFSILNAENLPTPQSSPPQSPPPPQSPTPRLVSPPSPPPPQSPTPRLVSPPSPPPPPPPPRKPASTSNQSFGGFGLGSLNNFQQTYYSQFTDDSHQTISITQPPAPITEDYTATTSDGVFLLTSQQEIELRIQQRAREIEREQQQINEKRHNLILHSRAEFLIDQTRRDYHDRFYRQPNRDPAKDDGIFYIPNGYISVNSDNWRNGGIRENNPSTTLRSNGEYRLANSRSNSSNTLWV
jgi:hypothetical protein